MDTLRNLAETALGAVNSTLVSAALMLALCLILLAASLWVLRRIVNQWANRPRRGAFSRGDTAAIVTVLALALVFVSVAFAMSAAALYASAEWLRHTPIPVNGGDLRFLFPLVLDGLIVMFLAMDLWTEWKGIRHPYYRWVAYGLSLLTLYLNVTASQGGSLLGHAAPPLGVIVISEGLAIWIRSMAGLVETGRVADRVPLGHWIARPASAFRVSRLMLGWNITSYEEAVAMERRRGMAHAMLREQYGDTWRRATPRHLRWMLNNGHDLDVAYDITRAMTVSRVALSAEEVSGLSPSPELSGDASDDTGHAAGDTAEVAAETPAALEAGESAPAVEATPDAPQVEAARDTAVAPVSRPVASLSDMAERDQTVVGWLVEDPDMSGAEIGRRTGVTSRTGQRLKDRLASVAASQRREQADIGQEVGGSGTGATAVAE